MNLSTVPLTTLRGGGTMGCMETTKQPYDPTPSPKPSLKAGQRVTVKHRDFAYGQEGHTSGVIVEYATPEIKQKQRWVAESYWVRFDDVGLHRPGGNARRLFDRDQISVMPS